MPRVCSFDLDGCLFHNKYPCSYSETLHSNAVIEINRALFNAILSDAKEDLLYVMIGSARQTHEMDRSNTLRNHTESGFQAITKVAQHLNAKIHPLLLADVYRERPVGGTFQRALDHKYDGSDHGRFEFDESKITILYAQMHDFANLIGSEKVSFDFYDDRYPGGCSPFFSVKKDILKHLGVYYTRYPEMIPSQITLRLFHYEGGARSLLYAIQGVGRVDLLYRDTIKKIMRISKTTCPSSDDNLFLASSPFHVSPWLLKAEFLDMSQYNHPQTSDTFPVEKHTLPALTPRIRGDGKKEEWDLEEAIEMKPNPSRRCRHRFFAATAALAVTTLAACYYTMQSIKS